MNNPFEQIEKEFEYIKTVLNKLQNAIPQISKPADEEEILSVKEVSQFLRLSVPTIYTYVNRGELPAMKRGRRLYFSKNDLIAYLKSGKKMSNAELEAAVNQYFSKSK